MQNENALVFKKLSIHTE